MKSSVNESLQDTKFSVNLYKTQSLQLNFTRQSFEENFTRHKVLLFLHFQCLKNVLLTHINTVQWFFKSK